jgi:hypothetical protein
LATRWKFFVFSIQKSRSGGDRYDAFQQIVYRPYIVYLAATLARMLAESRDMRAAATLPGLEERERLKMRKLKLSVLLCLSAAVFIIVRRPKRNHPSETPSTEEDCSWLNHGGFPTKGCDGH